MKTLHRTRGLAHELTVTREGRTVTLWSAGSIRHTVYDSTMPHLPGLEYARNMLAALAFCPQAQSCLVLGLGGGSIPRMMAAARPRIEVEAVEIDPAVVELATRYFGMGALPHLTIHLEDAAAFLRRCTSRYGIVILDTYVGESFPFQCATEGFIRDIGKCMAEDGVLAVNWLSGDYQLRDELVKNLKSTLGQVWQLPCLRSGNLLYFALTRTATRPEIISAAAAVEAELSFKYSLKRLAMRLRNPG